MLAGERRFDRVRSLVSRVAGSIGDTVRELANLPPPDPVWHLMQLLGPTWPGT